MGPRSRTNRVHQTTRRKLELQADQIETVLAQHNVAARVIGGTISPRWIRFRVLTASGAQAHRTTILSNAFARSLNVETCRIVQHNNQWTIQIPRPNPQPVRLLPLQQRLTRRQQLELGIALLGLTDDGAPLLVRLSSSQVRHLFIAGAVGSGKNALARTIISSLALHHHRSQLRFILIDLAEHTFGPLSGLPHLLRPVLRESEAIGQALQGLVRAMQDREKTGQRSQPRVVVVINELVNLLTMPEVQRTLTLLAQRGHKVGISLVACTRRPSDRGVRELVQTHFRLRLVGSVDSSKQAKAATGYAGTGAERLHRPGDFIAVTGGQVTLFQAAYASPREIVKVVSQTLRKEHSCNLAQAAYTQAPQAPQIYGATVPTALVRPTTQQTNRRSIVWLYWSLIRHLAHRLLRALTETG